MIEISKMNNRILELAESAGSTHKQNLGVYQFYEKELEDFVENIVRELVSKLEVDGSEFHYNQPNDYGSVTVTFFTGQGDPWRTMCGEEIMAEFSDGGLRGTGRYRLNENFVQYLVDTLK